MADTIRYQVSDNVAQITLDDGKVNAMALAFFAGLNAALDRAEHERPGALVIAGRAGVFSAGLDLKVLPTLAPDALERTMVAFGRTMLRVFTFPIPTVAAVTGHRSEEHTSELQSRGHLVCRLLLEKKNNTSDP